MKYSKALIIALVLVIFAGVACEAKAPEPIKPLGENSRSQFIETHFAGKTLESCEGVWLTSDNKYEVAVAKNTSGSFAGFDYLGVITDTTTNYKLGELKIMFKKTANVRAFPGVWFMEDRSQTNTMFFLADQSTMEVMLPTGPNSMPEKTILLKIYPKAAPPEQTKNFGVMLRPLEQEESKTLGLPEATGFLVIGTQNGSSADLMQIKLNDVLLAINGVDIASTKQLQEMMKGPISTVKVLRTGAYILLKAPLVF